MKSTRGIVEARLEFDPSWNHSFQERFQPVIYIYIFIYIYIPSSQHQHCTDEAQKAETVLSAVIYLFIYIYITADSTVSAFWASSVFLFLRRMAGPPVGKVQCPPDMTTKRLKRGCTSTPNSPGNRTPPLQA